MNKSISIFGIKFINENFNHIIYRLNQGDFMVIPSAPGLSTIFKDERYANAVKKADFALPDSGYMILLLRLFKKIKLKKYSGYSFLKDFLNMNNFKKNDLFLVDPNNEESKINNAYLNSIGIPINKTYHYVSPVYDDAEIVDQYLLDKLNSLAQKPKYIMINLGSGVQEPLGGYLKQNLDYNPGIICTGAAIAFFTGRQANISTLIDKVGLGWLWRCIKNPTVFIPRYFGAFGLFILILKGDIKVVK